MRHRLPRLLLALFASAALLALLAPLATRAADPGQAAPRKQLVDGQWRFPETPPPSEEAPPAHDAPALSASNLFPERWMRMVYAVFFAGRWDIWRSATVKDEYGGYTTESVRITQGRAVNLGPRLDPTAERIAFYAKSLNSTYDIYHMSWLGQGIAALTTDAADDILPAWSPDGRQIVFASRRQDSYDIYVMADDGSGQRPLAAGPGEDVAPSWSPDGRTIVWVRVASPDSGALWLMNADGSGQRQLTPPLRYAGNPHWSPDGTQIAFDYDHDGDGFNSPALINPDGGGLRSIVPPVTPGELPYDLLVGGWSPEGERLFLDTAYYELVDGKPQFSRIFISRVTVATAELHLMGLQGGSTPNGRSIDHVPPRSRLEPLPAFRRAGEVALRVSAEDSGIAGLGQIDVQYRVGGGEWTQWRTLGSSEGLPVFWETLVYSGTAGADVAFRARALDDAGNQEPWRALPDAQTTFFRTRLAGQVRDNRGYPAAASLQLDPAPVGAAAIDGAGRYEARLRAPAQTVAVSAPGFSAPPATQLTAVTDGFFNAMLLPTDNLLSDGGFEGGLGGWSQAGGPLAPRAASPAFTGASAAQLGAPCAGACLTAPEALPEDVGQQVRGIVVADDGRQHVLYQGFPSQLLYRTRLPGAAWSAPFEVAPGWGAAMALDAAGALHVVVRGDEDQLTYRSRSAAGVWSGATALDRASRPPWLHLDADGSLVLVFHCSGRLGCPDDAGAYTRVLTPGRGWGRLRALAHPPIASTRGLDGRVYIAWVVPDEGVYLGRLNAGGAVEESWLLWEERRADLILLHDALAVGPDGVVHLIAGYDGENMRYVRCLPAGDCGPATAIPGGGYEPGQLLADRQGGLHLVGRYDGPQSERLGLSYRYLPPGGAWTAPIRVAPSPSASSSMSLGPDDQLHLVADASYRSGSVGAPGESRVARTVTIPAAMHRPTLSFAYSALGLAPGASRLVVMVKPGEEAAVKVFASTTSGPWRTAWVDLEPWAGRTVTVAFVLEQVDGARQAAVSLDDVAVGSWRTPVLTATSPTRLPTRVASTLTISGANFLGTPQVLLGPTPLPNVQRVDEDTLRVSVPAGLRPGLYRLTVVNPGGQRSYVDGVALGERVNLPMLLR